MVAKIFNFRNVKVRIPTANTATNIYGVTAFDSANADKTVPQGVSPVEISTVLLTVQCSNITTGQVSVTAMVSNTVGSTTVGRMLVQNYPVIPGNAFDPLSGNLVLTAGDTLQIQCDTDNGIDVIVSLLEIANATAS